MRKKKRIMEYINSKDNNVYTDFDTLLQDFIDKNLKRKLFEIGLSNISVHVDWLPTIKCISIQGKMNKYFVEFQLDDNELSFAYDLDEADDDTLYPVRQRESVETYRFLETLIQSIK